MSFEVKPTLKVCHSCRDKNIFTLFDSTGPYDPILNPYGWEANGVSPQTQIQLGDVESSALTITSPAGTVYGPYDILADLPNLTGIGLTVDLTDILGSGDAAAYADGYWSFDWVVKGVYIPGGGNDHVFHERCLKQKLVLCDVECCVDRLKADSDPSCGCSGSGNKKAVNAMLTLEAINGAHNCGKKEVAKSHLSNLQNLCGNNCKNC